MIVKYPIKALDASFLHMRETARDLALGSFLLVMTIVGTVGLGNILDRIPLLVTFDTSVYEMLNFNSHPAWLDALVSPFNFNFLPWGGTFIPSFLYFVLAFGFIYVALRHRKDLLWTFVALLTAITINAIVYKITSVYVIRDRPFIHLPNTLIDSAKAIWRAWPTYPSGHVRDMALYSTVIVGYAHELLWPSVLFTLWIAFTRVYLGAHYPTDVLAGWALGILVGISVLWFIKPLRAHYLREQEIRKV